MKIFCKFPTVNISKLKKIYAICIAKNFIWITLKAIFSIFRFFLHPQIPDVYAYVYVCVCVCVCNLVLSGLRQYLILAVMWAVLHCIGERFGNRTAGGETVTLFKCSLKFALSAPKTSALWLPRQTLSFTWPFTRIILTVTISVTHIRVPLSHTQRYMLFI